MIERNKYIDKFFKNIVQIIIFFMIFFYNIYVYKNKMLFTFMLDH